MDGRIMDITDLENIFFFLFFFFFLSFFLSFLFFFAVADGTCALLTSHRKQEMGRNGTKMRAKTVVATLDAPDFSLGITGSD